MIGRILTFVGVFALVAPLRAEAASAPKYANLIAQLGDKDQAVRDAAAKRLVSIGAPALPSLDAALESPGYGPEHREQIAKIAAQIRDNVDKQAREIVGRKIPAALEAKSGRFAIVQSDDLEKLLPRCTVYSLRFQQFPVAREVPEPFKINNLFVVKADGSVRNVTEAKDLQDFIQDNAKVDTAAKARVAVKAWLRLAEDLENDGSFRFTIPDESITVGEVRGQLKVTGKAVVANVGGGRRGQITATLTFEQGQLLGVEQESNLRQKTGPL